MRIFLAILSGFCLTLIVFAGGAATTVVFLTAGPEPDHSPRLDTAAVPWTSKPVAVKSAANDPKDIGPQAGPAIPGDTRRIDLSPNTAEAADLTEPAEAGTTDGMVDTMTTAATSPAPASGPAPELSAAHVQWCSQHYRSYDPSANSYTAYSGEQRTCVSPYSGAAGISDPATETEDMALQGEDAGLITAAHTDEMPAATMDAAHIQSCFERYHSYRPEDNTYQPYGGGPRLPCE